ncbi:hypothetical protein NDU88_000165 [Pleurodeles waltl]|uniref:Uncharacterized protein n=1 Tax=Pleurodeles waltl TaxID=8319 RepID=A0AAV7MG29_PLEWA|nr:hypothetical protein NDU88_000165 [Pleurodeles waltl]
MGPVRGTGDHTCPRSVPGMSERETKCPEAFASSRAACINRGNSDTGIEAQDLLLTGDASLHSTWLQMFVHLPSRHESALEGWSCDPQTCVKTHSSLWTRPRHLRAQGTPRGAHQALANTCTRGRRKQEPHGGHPLTPQTRTPHRRGEGGTVPSGTTDVCEVTGGVMVASGTTDVCEVTGGVMVASGTTDVCEVSGGVMVPSGTTDVCEVTGRSEGAFRHY